MRNANIYEHCRWFRADLGPRYVQFAEYVALLVRQGHLPNGARLPSERELAKLAQVSRETIRKALALLAESGVINKQPNMRVHVAMRRHIHHKSTSTVAVQQSLSNLVSFTEHMLQKEIQPRSRILNCGIFTPVSDEQIALGLRLNARVARLDRLRIADNTPIAIEYTSLPEDILPNPCEVIDSLYSLLGIDGNAPVRAIQQASAINLNLRQADLLVMPEGTAVLKLDRTAYLANGRPIEYTQGVYRADMYDFVTELQLNR